jgi:hypothetical protein
MGGDARSDVGLQVCVCVVSYVVELAQRALETGAVLSGLGGIRQRATLTSMD